MKTKKFGKKLSLNKETVTNLDNMLMKNIQGGVVQADQLNDDAQNFIFKFITPYTLHPDASCNTGCPAGSCFAQCYITEFCIY